ncbi:hypothetical protein ES288_A03G176200v1 [Gossypium darwinii]|uniref:Uncharacterized protein n=1 Tax=Gossypium darwinii TaxID=34276 RepID=A0A5D2H6J1_GOSDA|nr:hypothetical protein ES288_A03G176200v1 [Gossypium darwinii]
MAKQSAFIRHTFNGEDGERVYGVTLAGKAFVNDEHNGSLAVFTSDKANIEVCVLLLPFLIWLA